MGVDVLHADPGGQGQRGVRPHPVHDRPQLRQEWNQAETTGSHAERQSVRQPGGSPGWDSPLEQEQVQVVVALGQEVPQNPGRVTGADLVGRQAEVHTLDKVPELGHQVLVEAPGDRQAVRETGRGRESETGRERQADSRDRPDSETAGTVRQQEQTDSRYRQTAGAERQATSR